MQLTEIRKELEFSSELVQLIETLKNIAAQQYHVMEREKERFDRFMDAFSGFFRVVDLVRVSNPLVKVSSDVLGVVVVTSDSGFMGGLNQNVMRAARGVESVLPEEKIALVVIGDKGAAAYAGQGREFKFFRGISQERIYEQAVEIKDYIVGEVMARRMGKVVVAYPAPVTFSSQTVNVINILPCGELFDKEADSEIARHAARANVIGGAIVESTFQDMVEYLSGTWIISKLYEVFEDSKLAEFSARVMHLEGSLQKLERDLKKIKRAAFKAAHEQIDKGMRESFAAGRTKRKRALATA